MEAEEKLVESREALLFAALEDAWFQINLKDGMKVEQARIHASVRSDMARRVLRDIPPESAVLSAAEAFISEAESMGYGKTSEKALPGSYDRLLKAVTEVRG